MDWRQFDEAPDVIPITQLAAALVSIADVIRESPTFRTALDPLYVREKCGPALGKCLNVLHAGPGKQLHRNIFQPVEMELVER